MEYARGLLEKYGWTEGKGLGKNETGISEPLKPKLKFDTTGIGHDHSEQFTFNWWELAFNNAASRVDVNVYDSPGASVKSSKKDDLILSTKRPWIAKLKKDKSLEYGSFVKTETLTNGGKVIPMDTNLIPSEDEQVSVIGLTSTLSDDELFRICGGRTAHKAARHGHKLVGKLARVNEQEKNQVTSPIVQENCNEASETFISDNEASDVRKKIRKKRKKVMFVESDIQSSFECENGSDELPHGKNNGITTESLNKKLELDNSCKLNRPNKKKKKCSATDTLELDKVCELQEPKKKKKKCFKTNTPELDHVCELKEPKKKKKKRSETDKIELDSVCELQEPKKKKKCYETDTIELDNARELKEPKKKCSEIEIFNIAPSKKKCKVTVFSKDSVTVCREDMKSKKKR